MVPPKKRIVSAIDALQVDNNLFFYRRRNRNKFVAEDGFRQDRKIREITRGQMLLIIHVNRFFLVIEKE